MDKKDEELEIKDFLINTFYDYYGVKDLVHKHLIPLACKECKLNPKTCDYEMCKEIDLKNLNEYAKKSLEEIKSIDEDFLKDYLDCPAFTQLQCDNMSCKYNEPKDAEMGVITYCSKYKNGEKGCKDREWKELIIG